ncbi:nucleolar protein 8 [Leuresthes tenuis]|uniref:nucleolar protein 8 n=1 Tax=Leuresthes tenuis TaxID=355514 RepID=UPI003B511787
MRRLYVGGLSHTVTQKDLKDRFGKFGEVEDVELRTKRDEEGVPYKTFGYININVSDADLKKCMTVLNKSKWKGGTLQIEMAKESFLHRLAQERQEAAEQQPAAEDKKQKLLDSFSKAGVDNFTMKAAVPGTEVPGHEDWVVSKFGRVLPVLQLRCRKGSKARTVKFDPSKYSHNIRKLDRNATDPSTPVTQLTWEVGGGDDDISKKRRGEFPPYEPSRPKRTRTDGVGTCERFQRSAAADLHTEAHRITNGCERPADRRPAQRRDARFTESDSDEDLRRLVAAQQNSHGALQQEEDDYVEVVGLDYLVTSGQKGEKDEDGYDSADTDELFASRKNPPPPPQEKLSPPTAEQLSGNHTNRKTKKKSANVEQEEEESEHFASTKQKTAALPVMKASSESAGDEDDEEEEDEEEDDEEEDDEDDEDEEEESADSCSDSDYEAMFSNVTRLEISFTDLRKLAEAQQTSETTAPSILGSGPNAPPAERPAPKKGTTPEEILAALLEDSGEDEKKKKRKRKGATSAPLPVFMGTKSLSETDECQRKQREEEGGGVKKLKVPSEAPQVNHTTPDSRKTSGSSEEEEEDDSEEGNMAAAQALQTLPHKVLHPETDSDSSCEEEDERKMDSVEATSSSSSEEEEDEEEEEQAPPRQVLGPEEEEELQRKANMRRLAALQQRQKEAEEHKRLIQGALANLDAPAPKAGKHIVFGSDDDEEEEDGDNKQQTVAQITPSKKILFEDSQSEDGSSGEEAVTNQRATKEKVQPKPSGSQLFGGSEDEEDGDEEEDGGRFDIRPQFEGRAGQKLMALQSRFGTDERFRMDARFVDEDGKEEEAEPKRSLTEEEEALEEEKKKTLSILQSVLGSSQQTSSSKTPTKAKKFRDVSALHYDPSREEHTAFETKTDETKKESKSARRKKREEAQKLPEVSKEIYYDVSGDLKAVFGQTKDGGAEGEEKPTWDRLEEAEERGKEEEELPSSLPPDDPSTKEEEASGFKFSFFGDEVDAGGGETMEYEVEIIKAPKVSWQQESRFHDSSSDEEEEEEQDEDEEQSGSTAKTAEEENPSKLDPFFFHHDDVRLKEGPKLFCRTSRPEEDREQWEERRTALRQEYRKKHKDARRKLTASWKS